MFALLAFILGLFHVQIGSIDLVILGLIFITAHLLFDFRPWGNRRVG